MKYYLLLATLFVSTCFVSAQTQFQKTTGSTTEDLSYQLITMPDSSIMATGTTNSVPGNQWDSYLINFDRFGEVNWAFTFGDVGDETTWDITLAQNNDIVGAGTTTSMGTPFSASTISRVSSSGTISWLTGIYSTTGNVDFYRVIETSSGHFLATGLVTTPTNQDDILLCKFTGSGALLWSKAVGSAENDEAMGMIETAQGDYLLAGLTQDNNGNGGRDFAAVKLDSAGNVIWKKNYGGTGSERMNSVLEIGNAYYFCGWSSSAGQGKDDIILMKTDTAGNVSWTNAYGTVENERAFNMLYNDSDSAIVLAGYTEYSGASTNRNTLLMSVGLTGNMNWAKSYGSNGTDGHWPTGLTQNHEEGYYVLGISNSFSGGNDDLYLIKTGDTGDAACHQKDPQFTQSAVTGWSGSNFGGESSISLTSTAITGTSGSIWNIQSSTECCLPFIDAGEDSVLCPGDTVLLGSGTVPGYSYSWTVNGGPVSNNADLSVIYGQEGMYVLEAAFQGPGCEILDTVMITDDIRPPLGFDDEYSFCAGDSVELNTTATFDSLHWYSTSMNMQVAQGNSYTAKTSDTLVLQTLSANQCWYEETIEIIAHPVPATPTITTNGAQLTSSPANAYQWYFQGNAIPGADQPNHIATGNGYYFVEVTNTYGCSARSDSVMVIIGGIDEYGLFDLSIHPNPSTGIVYLETAQNTGTVTIELFDLSGKRLFLKNGYLSINDREKLDLGNLSKGIYTLKVTGDDGTAIRQVVIVD